MCIRDRRLTVERKARLSPISRCNTEQQVRKHIEILVGWTRNYVVIIREGRPFTIGKGARHFT
eukprot:4662384-Lingulodinium_polyedra.AAC.1